MHTRSRKNVRVEELSLPLGECMSTFNLEKAVCNHGFFMMAPNRWVPSSKTLERPLRLADSTTCVTVSIQHPPNHTSLLIQVYDHIHNLSFADKDAILQQVRRMLRISKKDERAIREYHEVHPEAKEKGCGRVFRSPTLFEDLVKCILLCNTKWSNTLQMARSLCELHTQVCNNNNAPAKQKQPINLKRKKEMLSNTWSPCKLNHQFSDDGSSFGNFPNAQELAGLDLDTLQNCSTSVLGYRANTILKLAKIMRLDDELGFQESLNIGFNDMFQKLKEIKGFGSFSCANALMCMGYYHKVPTDTETIRHLQQVHGRKDCDKTSAGKDAEEIYDKYAPFQCLAYLSELLDSYEGKFGKLSELPASSYHIISGRLERKGEEKTMMN
ncbi:hypothetical protein ACFX2I_000008 [Malus domestica]